MNPLRIFIVLSWVAFALRQIMLKPGRMVAGLGRDRRDDNSEFPNQNNHMRTKGGTEGRTTDPEGGVLPSSAPRQITE